MLLVTFPCPLFAQIGQTTLHPLWSHQHGGFDESAAEVVGFAPANGQLYVTNVEKSSVDVLNLSSGKRTARWDISQVGEPHSLAVCDAYVVVAVAAQKGSKPPLT